MNTDEKLKKSKIIAVGNAFIGGGHYAYIAGPCAVESENGLYEIAKAVKAAGATILRAGAYKPRTSPHDFQGLGADGIEVETHNDPKRALCDGAQAVLPARFAEIVEKTEKIRKAIL